jgi:nucleotide-binding universal stress UspA family protein
MCESEQREWAEKLRELAERAGRMIELGILRPRAVAIVLTPAAENESDVVFTATAGREGQR